MTLEQWVHSLSLTQCETGTASIFLSKRTKIENDPDSAHWETDNNLVFVVESISVTDENAQLDEIFEIMSVKLKV